MNLKMSTSEVVVIDSSDDEDNKPAKKIKLDTSYHNDNGLLRIKIENVKSLAPNETNNLKSDHSDVVVIEDDCNLNNSPLEFLERTKQTIESDSSISLSDKFLELDNGGANSVHSTNTKSTDILEEPSTSKESSSLSEVIEEFDTFLTASLDVSEGTKYKDVIHRKIPKIREKYLSADPRFLTSKSFLNMLTEKCESLKSNPVNVCIYFNDVYQELKIRKVDKEKDDNEMSDRRVQHLKKLFKTLKLLKKKIKQLEETEVDWDDEDSAYLKEDRYQKRLVQVHKKICELTQENEYATRITHRKLDFCSSQYTEINRSIDRLYNKLKRFPTYEEIDKVVRKCVKDHNINITETSLVSEIKEMFKQLGHLLKRRRQHELEDSHCYFLVDHVDPAADNPELDSKLKEQYKIGQKKIEEIMQKFTERQEKGEDVEVSDIGSESNDDTNENAEN